MAQITVTGTADQIRRIGHLMVAVADESVNPRSVTVTLDNGVTGAALALTTTGGSGKRRDG